MAAKRPPRATTGLAWGEGQIREFLRADGSTRVQVRWWERQPDGDRKLRTKSFTHADRQVARDEAEDFLRQNRRDRRDGRYVPPADLTVKEVLEDYIARGRGQWKASTYATYRQRAYAQLIPGLGAVRVVELTTARIQYWIDAAARAKRHPKTLDEAVRLLSGALNEAARLGIVRHNEARGVKTPAVAATPHRTWTDIEIAKILSAVAEDPMWHALYRVALFTGLRPGELRAMTWSDLDLGRGVLTVRRTMTRDHDNREVVGATTKTGRNRAIALPASAVTALERWRDVQDEHAAAFVFVGRGGNPLGATTWQKYQAALSDRAGVPYIGLHELRHTNATVELAAGTHPKIVSDRLGHRKIETTLNLYSHVSPELQRTAADALEARIAAAGTTTSKAEKAD